MIQFLRFLPQVEMTQSTLFVTITRHLSSRVKRGILKTLSIVSVFKISPTGRNDNVNIIIQKILNIYLCITGD